MIAEQSIQSINVVVDTLLVQVLFLAILGITGRLYRARRWSMLPINFGYIGNLSPPWDGEVPFIR